MLIIMVVLLAFAMLALGIVVGLGVGYAIAMTHVSRVTRRQDVRPVAPGAPTVAAAAPPTPAINRQDVDRHFAEVASRSGKGIFKISPTQGHVIPGSERPC